MKTYTDLTGLLRHVKQGASQLRPSCSSHWPIVLPMSLFGVFNAPASTDVVV